MTIKSLQIKFKGIDDWYRAVYKIQGRKMYVGDVNKLWEYEDTKEAVDAYYKDNLKELVLFGSEFNEGDPLGSSVVNSIKVSIV